MSVLAMPELPEVEIVRRELAKLRGSTIVRLESNDARIFEGRIDVVDRVIREVGRRGKWLRFELDEGLVFSHLGMTGDWTLRAEGDGPLPFERLRMTVARKGEVTSARYTDPRRFGRFIATASDIEAWQKLGPDPWLEGIDEPRLLALLEKRRRAVKEVLLDQGLLAGVGNILAIEGLWRARIDPRAPAWRMTARDVHAIAAGLRAILEQTIAYDEKVAGGGHPRTPFRIYGRANEPCPRCGTALRQIVLGGRGTTFCPHCQKPHR
jgi:formamidopyrimidine-DNA glycosylase